MVNKMPCLLAYYKQTYYGDQLLSDYSGKSSYMSEDLLVEIFKRLPVKTLGRMRCVCKSWNSVISSPTFITHHLHHSSSIPAPQKSYLALNRFGKIDSYAFYHPDDQMGPPSFEHCTKWFDQLPFQPFPFHSPPNPFMCIDLIHGIVCLTSSLEDTSSPTVLWNPTIRKYVKIPNSPFKCRDINHYVHTLGFGFHSRKDDFMLIRLWMPAQQPAGPKRLLGYQAFSTQNGVWKKAVVATRIRPGKVISEASFFMNGTIHWIVSAYKVRKEKEKENHKRHQRTEYYRLLMFDCEREEWTEMVLPRAFNRKRREFESFKATIFKCRGMLVVLMFMVATFELWAMEEYGVSSTWKKLPVNEGVDELSGFVSEESMFLMDAKNQAVSYTVKRGNGGKVYYEIGGRTGEHIRI